MSAVYYLLHRWSGTLLVHPVLSYATT